MTKEQAQAVRLVLSFICGVVGAAMLGGLAGVLLMLWVGELLLFCVGSITRAQSGRTFVQDVLAKGLANRIAEGFIQRTPVDRGHARKDWNACPVCGESDCGCCPIPECHTPGCTSSHK